MDPTNRTLDSMITIPHPSQIGDFIESQRDETQLERPAKRRAIDDDAEMELVEETDNTSAWTKGSAAIPESECDFTSIQELRREVGKGNQGESIVIIPADCRCGGYHAQTCFRWNSRSLLGIVLDSIFNEIISRKSYFSCVSSLIFF
jgi:hypothetical protein